MLNTSTNNQYGTKILSINNQEAMCPMEIPHLTTPIPIKPQTSQWAGNRETFLRMKHYSNKANRNQNNKPQQKVDKVWNLLKGERN